MAPITALFTSAFLILCSHNALAAPDAPILPRGDLRPRFTPAAGISGFVTGTIGSYPTGTGSGCIGPTGTGYVGIPSAIPPYPGAYNTTIVGPTGTCTGTGVGTGAVGPTGTGATGAVSATGAAMYPIYSSEKEKRSQKAARNWWA